MGPSGEFPARSAHDAHCRRELVEIEVVVPLHDQVLSEEFAHGALVDYLATDRYRGGVTCEKTKLKGSFFLWTGTESNKIVIKRP